MSALTHDAGPHRPPRGAHPLADRRSAVLRAFSAALGEQGSVTVAAGPLDFAAWQDALEACAAALLWLAQSEPSASAPVAPSAPPRIEAGLRLGRSSSCPEVRRAADRLDAAVRRRSDAEAQLSALSPRSLRRPAEEAEPHAGTESAS
jgi:hypothetical protein